MHLEYPNKKKVSEILTKPISVHLKKTNNITSTNKLLIGDNYQVMRCMLDDLNMASKVNMVYIDPPFSTNTVFRISEDRANTISSSNEDKTAYEDTLKGSEFIEFLRERVILLRELMSETGSFYLHIDYKIGHYVKVMLDEIFGVENFRNDITRIKCNPKNFKRKAYGNIKDLILFYTKSKDYIWNEPKVLLSENDIDKLFKKIDHKGRRYTTVPIHAPGETANGPTGKPWKGMEPPKGRHWRCSPEELEQLDEKGLIEWSKTGNPRRIIYADEKIENGKKLQDIWEYKDPQYPDYPTQKNRELLDLIISTSSNEGDLVMDCFVGSGTTIVSANELRRNWIGIDKSKEAIEVTVKRLTKTKTSSLFNSNMPYEIYNLENS
ncbi:MAG TPA: site-specific DNA-methyltransferase [Anaerohalosphaeraceae bacterium]|nr:site-specific DNA-methyltransferase [Anaerohalosphaeraceae bacterium]